MNTMAQARHTPTPWRVVEADGKRNVIWNSKVSEAISDDKEMTEANAEFIVRAVNSHEALVEALRGMVKYVDSLPLSDIKHQNGYWVKAKLALNQAEAV